LASPPEATRPSGGSAAGVSHGGSKGMGGIAAPLFARRVRGGGRSASPPEAIGRAVVSGAVIGHRGCRGVIRSRGPHPPVATAASARGTPDQARPLGRAVVFASSSASTRGQGKAAPEPLECGRDRHTHVPRRRQSSLGRRLGRASMFGRAIEPGQPRPQAERWTRPVVCRQSASGKHANSRKSSSIGCGQHRRFILLARKCRVCIAA
jgi:hypothetical protein